MSEKPSTVKFMPVKHTPINLISEHRFWCPWVCKLPSYHISKTYRNNPATLLNEVYFQITIITYDSTSDKRVHTSAEA